MSQPFDIPGEGWEVDDASAYFPTEGRAEDRLHTNKITQIDPKDLKYDPNGQSSAVGSSTDGEQAEPQDGDSYTDADPEEGHVDEMFEMEGLQGGSPDNREMKADKVEDERTEAGAEEDGLDEPEPERLDKDESTDNSANDLDEDRREPEEDDGAEAPIQKESEGIEEVAPATDLTSEDVHGGEEATKDVKDSPNAANSGEDPDNHGAEVGEGGGDEDSEAEPLAAEDWEDKAEQSALQSQLEQAMWEWQDSERPTSSVGGGAGVDYRSFRKMNVSSLRAVFHNVRELVRRLVSEEDITRKDAGEGRYWAEEIVRCAVSCQHHLIPRAKFEHPVKNNLVFFVDISGSVQSLAELFMALMGGAAGLPGVRIVVGSEAHAENEIIVERPFQDVETAVEFFRNSVNGHVCDDPLCPTCKGKIRNVGWRRAYESPFEPGVLAFLRDHELFTSTTTCVFFGDMQGVHFNLPELRKIVRTCKCLWLFTDEPGHYTHTGDLPIALKAGLPIAYNIRDAQRFVRAVRRIRDIRPGLQIL